MKSTALALPALFVTIIGIITGCSRDGEEIAAERYIGPDGLFDQVYANVRADPAAEVIVDIDHSRLAAEAGSPMPPSHVLIWSESEVEAAILAENRMAAIDLPLRVLAYENQSNGTAAITFNNFNYLARRFDLANDSPARTLYDAAFARALTGIAASAVTDLPLDTMSQPGLITLISPYDFTETKQRMLDAVTAESDTVVFGELDFAARSKKWGVDLEPTELILWGSPGPGGKAMASAPTLGLDAFCQKLLILQDADGTARVIFNDLTALAERQQVSGGIPLRLINRRIQKTFTDALK
jgi:uncharacterized protein (DUF302 family)